MSKVGFYLRKLNPVCAQVLAESGTGQTVCKIHYEACEQREQTPQVSVFAAPL